MDGVSDDSPWPPAILAIDSADRLIHGDTLPIVILSLTFSYYAVFGSWLDLLLNLVFLGLGNGVVHASLTPDPALVQLSFSSGLIAVIGWLIFSRMRSRPAPKDAVAWKGPARPFLVPCQTTHTRLFPKKHSFSYSYLVAGVPVGYTGNVNGLLSIDQRRSGRKGWYDVDAVDYLQRGHGHLGLRGKLDTYLRSQHVDPLDYPNAYLITAARFLGYHFNPVSFWYLYSPDKVLSAIVLEVNNTFGERRPYLVLRDFAEEAKLIPDTLPAAAGAAPCRVKGCWPKDFHVSPFNSRKGSYSLLANDPLGANMEGFRGLDITINLRSSKGQPKLVARLFSEGEAADPSTLSGTQKLRFLLGWHWVGFLTFPRIVREAFVLFFKRRLHVWYRPEPLKESLGRHADSIEKDLEGVFRKYLQFLVDKCPKPLSVRYFPSGVTDITDETYYTSSTVSTEPRQAVEQVEIRILTPVFYSRFVHYAHDFEGIFSELMANGTIWVDKPQVLPDIFLKKRSPTLHTANVTDFACFKLMQKLRRRPGRIPPVSTSAEPPSSSTRVADIRDFRISSMDAYVLEHNDRQLAAVYRAAVLRLLMADRFFLRSVALLRTAEYAGHAGLGWISAWALGRAMAQIR